MSATTHTQVNKIGSGASDWPALFNAFADIFEKGRTVKLTASVALTFGEPFYVNGSGQAAKATLSTPVVGIWQTTSTGAGAQGLGNVGGLMTGPSWTWTPGGKIYVTAGGAISQTAAGKPIGVAISATEVIVFPSPGIIEPSSAIKQMATMEMAEARSKINQILTVLRTHGLIGATVGTTTSTTTTTTTTTTSSSTTTTTTTTAP